jgi:adenylosuccinate lyase
MELKSISPLDGRYSDKISPIKDIFNEYGIIKNRIYVELYYLLEFIRFLRKRGLSDLEDPYDYDYIKTVINNFTIEEAVKVKKIEKEVNHDVKAVEYYLRQIIDPKYHPYIHFGLTSQDINSIVYIIQLNEINHVMRFNIKKLIGSLDTLANKSNFKILSLTHGQPATPTSMYNQLNVFIERIKNVDLNFKMKTKFGGATGGFNAHKFAYHEISDLEWKSFRKSFVKDVCGSGIHSYTTQIDHYDLHGFIFNEYSRISTILIDLCQDIWLYISRGIFKQRVIKGEVGSSTMPHKINPIKFENAEGNLHIAISLFQLFSRKLPISRMQRDLTDSTVLRNIGCGFGYLYLAIGNIIDGLGLLEINEEKCEKELSDNLEVIGEGIQMMMRRYGYSDAYEKMKSLSRGSRLGKELLRTFIGDLSKVPEDEKERMRLLEPDNY